MPKLEIEKKMLVLQYAHFLWGTECQVSPEPGLPFVGGVGSILANIRGTS